MDDSVIERYHKQKLEQEVKGIVKAIRHSVEEEMHDHGKVVKTVPMTEEQKKVYLELEELSEKALPVLAELKQMMGKIRSSRDYMWGMIARDLRDYRPMHIDVKTWDILVYDDEEETEE